MWQYVRPVGWLALEDGVLMTAWHFHCAVGAKPRAG
jgi:hypothetical protein